MSHPPHVAAFALVHAVADIDPSFLSSAGQGFRDTTRIAMSSPEMWVDICRHNRNNLGEHIDRLIRRLEEVRDAIRRDDAAFLERCFREARDLRRSIG